MKGSRYSTGNGGAARYPMVIRRAYGVAVTLFDGKLPTMILPKRVDGLCFVSTRQTRVFASQYLRVSVSRARPELRQPLVDLRQQVGWAGLEHQGPGLL